MLKILLVLWACMPLVAGVAVSGDSYERLKTPKIDMVYAKEYDQALVDRVLSVEDAVITQYQKSYGYDLDDAQYLGLLSSNNQIANAFSSQMPYNRQINYIGGALIPNYFATSSWIENLLWHESAHNFQMNPKKNLLSYYAHKVVGNTPLTFFPFTIVPIFPVPNGAESSFILEGNAVLNESRQGNGGRLYSGAFLAMTITQARAGYITPERTYNDHLYFPYRTHHYIIGGFFQLYLAKQHGVDAVNRYFYNFSGQWIPIFTNMIFEESYAGVDYEKSLKGFESWILKRYKGFKPTKGEALYHSTSMVELNSDDEEIYFLTSDDHSAPWRVVYDKKTMTWEREKSSLGMGKVFKRKGTYLTLASGYTEPERVMIGLFDEDGSLLEGSAGKAVQALRADGSIAAYFDIKSSFDRPMLYVDDAFYAKVNSSVLRYHDDYYYFVQEGKKRVLYKNKTVLVSFESWYGFVCDVDEDGVYFISNTANGSGLFVARDGVIARVSEGDDVLDAKLLGNHRALLEVIEADGIAFKEVALQEKVQSVHTVRYFFDKQRKSQPKVNKAEPKPKVLLKAPYNPLTNMHYSATALSLATDSTDVSFNIAVHSSDPLSQNSLSIFTARDKEDFIAGLGYDSNAYRLKFGAKVFAVLDHNKSTPTRDIGTQFYLSYPIWRHKYEAINARLNYQIEPRKFRKEPLVFTMDYRKVRQYGHSFYPNLSHGIKLSAGLDRGDSAFGVDYHYSQDIASELYAGIGVVAVSSSATKSEKRHGVLLEKYRGSFSDALSIEMPSISQDAYAKEVLQGELSLAKVFHWDAYSFHLPFSLRREAVYGKYHYYQVKKLSGDKIDIHEGVLGLTMEFLMVHSLALPISFEYIYNEDLEEANHFRMRFNLGL